MILLQTETTVAGSMNITMFAVASVPIIPKITLLSGASVLGDGKKGFRDRTHTAWGMKEEKIANCDGTNTGTRATIPVPPTRSGVSKVNTGTEYSAELRSQRKLSNPSHTLSIK